MRDCYERIYWWLLLDGGDIIRFNLPGNAYTPELKLLQHYYIGKTGHIHISTIV